MQGSCENVINAHKVNTDNARKPLEVNIRNLRGAWVAQSVNHPTSAQVMVSRFVSSSPASGSVLTAQSLDPASDSMSPFLYALSLSQK